MRTLTQRGVMVCPWPLLGSLAPAQFSQVLSDPMAQGRPSWLVSVALTAWPVTDGMRKWSRDRAVASDLGISGIPVCLAKASSGQDEVAQPPAPSGPQTLTLTVEGVLEGSLRPAIFCQWLSYFPPCPVTFQPWCLRVSEAGPLPLPPPALVLVHMWHLQAGAPQGTGSIASPVLRADPGPKALSLCRSPVGSR